MKRIKIIRDFIDAPNSFLLEPEERGEYLFKKLVQF